MNTKKIVAVVLGFLVIVTAVLAVVHLQTQPKAEGNSILINEVNTKIEEKDAAEVSGKTINGKGEEKEVNGKAILVNDIIGNDYETATVTAKDEYSAETSPADEAYIFFEEDGSFTMIVFGDQNSKRNVKEVQRIDYK